MQGRLWLLLYGFWGYLQCTGISLLTGAKKPHSVKSPCMVKPRMTSRHQAELFAQPETILMVSDEPVTVEQVLSSLDRPTRKLEVTLLSIQRDYECKTHG